MVSLAFVRSPHAHAAIRRVDPSAARRLDGVLAVLTAADLRQVARPLHPRLEGDGFTPTAWPVLADDRACFCGEAVAAVVATSAQVAADARELVRVEYEALPVKWVEERRESLAAGSQARAQRMEVEVAAEADGVLRGLRARAVSDGGAYHIYPLTGALEPLGSAAILPGPYRTPAYEYQAVTVLTHKPPLGAYRGVGMTMGAFVMERLLDMVAERLGLDPAEVRRRNLIPREAYPFTSASGLTYDSGDFPKALEQVLAAVDYDRLRRDQAAARAAGRLVGVGVACYTEYTGMGAAVFRRRGDRKSTRLNSSHTVISYAVFCLKKKKNKQN